MLYKKNITVFLYQYGELSMKLKLDENGGVVLLEGKPVYVQEDGKEIPFDAAAAMSKIAALNAEAKEHRLKKNELAEQLKKFEGIEDPNVALDAIEKIKNLDMTKMLDVDKVEQLKRQMADTFEVNKKSILDGFEKEKRELRQALEAKDKDIYKLMVSSQFSKSPFFSGENPKTLLPADMATEYFGKHFKIEENRIVGYLDGEKILSKTKYGELADFDEALETIIEKYPMKDRILRAGHAGGPPSGGNSSPGQNSNAVRRNDQASFIKNIEDIAKGKLKVI